MAKRTIHAVGFELPEVEGLECVSLRSGASLLDADVVLFRPCLSKFDFGSEQHDGQRLISQSSSFSLTQQLSHWKSQLFDVSKAGKTVIFFLPQKQQVLHYLGTSAFSGTGRSRVQTNHVGPVCNYDFLPLKLQNTVAGYGLSMKLAPKADVIAAFWKELGDLAVYWAHFEAAGTPLILTKAGNKCVGLRWQAQVLVLPDLNFYEDGFHEEDGRTWSSMAEKFAYKFRDQIFLLDASLRGNSESTPEPEWAQASEYRMAIEKAIEADISELSAALERISSDREAKRRELADRASLRALLYEKGKRLEEVVRHALKMLGFEVSHLADGQSEFDALFSSAEGRFLGEVEGKDDKWINIDKYSQLERNLIEDFQRDEVTARAQGVLFGNAYRLTPVASRGDFFTPKLRADAEISKVALVRTPDLFLVAAYLTDNADLQFAEECRKAIAAGAGKQVQFPGVPTTNVRIEVDT